MVSFHGFYYTQHLRPLEAKIAIEPVVELALKSNYKRRLTQIYTIQGIHSLALEEDIQKAAEFFEKAIQLAEATNNMASLVFANHFLGHVFVEDCQFDKAYKHINKALQIVKMGNVLWSIAMHTSCIAMWIYFWEGKIDLAYQSSIEGLRLAEESGDILSKAEAHASRGMCSYGKGFLEEAEQHFLMQAKLGQRSKMATYTAWANIYLGIVNMEMGEYRKAMDFFNDALCYENQKIMPLSTFNYTRITLANAKVMSNDKDIDLKALYMFESENKRQTIAGRNKRTIGEILLNLDENHLQDAQQWFLHAIETDEKHGMRFELGMDHAVYAGWFLRSGDKQKVKEKLGEAIDIFTECGADGWVEKYEKELAELS